VDTNRFIGIFYDIDRPWALTTLSLRANAGWDVCHSRVMIPDIGEWECSRPYLDEDLDKLTEEDYLVAVCSDVQSFVNGAVRLILF